MKSKIKKLFLSMLMVFCICTIAPSVFPQMTNTVEAASIKLNKSKVTLELGKSMILKVSGTKKKVTWSSSKKAVATVNKSGKVVANKTGTTVISAKVDKKTLKCTVVVKAPTISKKSVKLKVGSSVTLKMNGTKSKVIWSSSNKSIATVNKYGKVTAKKAGKATITATVLGRKYKCSVTVEKKPTPQKPSKTYYFNKLKSYILTYGSLNQAGNMFLREEDNSNPGYTWVWCIILNSDDEIEFMVSRERYGKEKMYGEVFIDRNLNVYIKYEYSLFDDDGMADAVTYIDPATYRIDSKHSYNIVMNSTYYNSQTISKLADIFLSAGFEGWKVMLESTGVTFKNLGFALL